MQRFRPVRGLVVLPTGLGWHRLAIPQTDGSGHQPSSELRRPLLLHRQGHLQRVMPGNRPRHRCRQHLRTTVRRVADQARRAMSRSRGRRHPSPDDVRY